MEAAVNLPGESARASLKRGPERVNARPESTSPGRIGPGLIEAAEISAACRQRRYLPGESARASLKHGGGGTESGSRVESPGRIGPGLIEAREALSGKAAHGPISRANRPGPH